MKHTIAKIFCLLILLGPASSYAQSSNLARIVADLEYQQDTVQAIYDYVAKTIAYDVQLLAERSKRGYKNVFKGSKAEYEEQLLSQTISSKKAVCEGYALLLHKLLVEHGYPSHVVEGYTKDRYGKLNRRVSHAWNVAYVDGKWRLYDVTWGAGSVKDGKKFIKNYNTAWYDVKPKDMLVNHMPFDPVWQLMPEAITYKSFEKDITEATIPNDYKTIVADMEGKSDAKLLKESIARSEKLGKGMRLVSNWRKLISGNSTIGDLNSTSAQMQTATDLYNEYVTAKNGGFADERWSYGYAVEHLLDIQAVANDAKVVFDNAKVKGRESNSKLKQAKKNTDRFLQVIEKELAEMLPLAEE